VFINGARSTPIHVRSSPYYFTHVLAPRETTQAENSDANFAINSNRALVQRKATKKVANSPPGTNARCHFEMQIHTAKAYTGLQCASILLNPFN
jgi:hypothetical protein